MYLLSTAWKLRLHRTFGPINEQRCVSCPIRRMSRDTKHDRSCFLCTAKHLLLIFIRFLFYKRIKSKYNTRRLPFLAFAHRKDPN